MVLKRKEEILEMFYFKWNFIMNVNCDSNKKVAFLATELNYCCQQMWESYKMGTVIRDIMYQFCICRVLLEYINPVSASAQ